MADIKRDQERDELFRSIYKIATDLVHAGHVSEWDFKSYVLGTMFYRYISENFASYINAGEHAAGNAEFDYAKMPDAEAESAREGLVQEKGFFILPSELFCNVLACADKDENLNETLERVFNHIESSAASGDAENDFAGLFDDFDVNSKSIGETVAKRNKVLAELLHGVDRMPLFSTDGINPDLFGDAYESARKSVCPVGNRPLGSRLDGSARSVMSALTQDPRKPEGHLCQSRSTIKQKQKTKGGRPVKQLVPVRKQSKKAQRSFFAQKRGSWMGLNPVTRTVQSRKAYDRNRVKQADRRSPEESG